MDNMLQFLIMKPEQLILIYHALLMRNLGVLAKLESQQGIYKLAFVPLEHSDTEKPFSQ